MEHGTARFLRFVVHDVAAALSTPEAMDESMPGVLERKSQLTMTRLWDAETWQAHRSVSRWANIVWYWPSSSILKAIRVPFMSIIAFTVAAIAFNRLLESAGMFRLTMPLAPISLQSASIGLLLVFRNNQTHDRLKEAQRACGGLGALAREIVQLMVVHVDVESARDIGLVARLLAVFGWALKTHVVTLALAPQQLGGTCADCTCVLLPLSREASKILWSPLLSRCCRAPAVGCSRRPTDPRQCCCVFEWWWDASGSGVNSRQMPSSLLKNGLRHVHVTCALGMCMWRALVAFYRWV